MSRIRAYARLFRIPNLPTCAADVVGGFFVAAGADSFNALWGSADFAVQGAAWPSLLLLVAGSMLLYCGGMADNDVQHVDKDHVLKSNRPIPNGEISLVAANRVVGAAFAAGIVLAWSSLRLPTLRVFGAGDAGLLLLFALLIAVFSKIYNRLAAGKTVEFTYMPPTRGANVIGLVLLALCRVFNVGMGFVFGTIAIGERNLDWVSFGLLSALVFAYFTLVIIASLFEDSGAKVRVAKILLGFALILGIAAFPLGLFAAGSHWLAGFEGGLFDSWALMTFAGLLGACFGLVVSKCLRAIRSPSPRNMGMIVKWGIAGDCFLMGALAAVSGPEGALAGLVIGALFLLCVYLGRFAKAT